MINSKDKIDSLTGLRFFAALMIVILHTNNIFIKLPSFIANIFNGVPLQLGVSVFFVLSGFILTYSYPTLSRDQIFPFIRSRIARIWPAHMAALILACIVMHEYVQLNHTYGYFILSSMMLHCWIPLQGFFLKFNQPAWSISTEFFFYLCFPFLIYRFNRNWYLKLIIISLLTIAIIYTCYHFEIPDNKEYGISTFSLVYYNPWCRIFEFVIGMCGALLYSKLRNIKINVLIATSLEISCVYLAFYSFKHCNFTFLGTPGTIWSTMSGGSAIVIALLISVLAFQQGLISWILSTRLMIFLGEISYSLYLIHNIFLSYYGIHPDYFAKYSFLTISSAYWLIVFSVTVIMWHYIEKPCRKHIRNFEPVQIWRTFRKSQLVDEIVK